ncbi:MAG: hypothetical protein KQH79_00480 [Bacteroidetes bacterium]|nr:hypothetical protein [Bacteroidota bacterium]
MKEKDFDNKLSQEETKLEWEAPKLFCLDKKETEGGPLTATTETFTGGS